VNAFLTIVIPSRFIAEESTSAGKTADSSRDAAALRNDNFEEVFMLHHPFLNVREYLAACAVKIRPQAR